MKVYITQSIQNDNYVFLFSVDPASISTDDGALFAKYGQQSIDFGGVINVYASYNSDGSGISSITDTFTLTDIYFNLPGAFPVQQSFTTVSPSPFATNTANRLAAYKQAISNRIFSAVTTLRETGDTFTGESILNV